MLSLRSAATCAVLTSAALLTTAPSAFAAASEVHLRAGAAVADSAVTTYAYGAFGDQHLLCDWDGDGRATPAVYRPSTATWYLRQSPGGGNADLSFRYGTPGAGDRVLCGDWDDDGDDTVGVKQGTTPAVWSLNNENDASAADLSFTFGSASDLPVVWERATANVGVFKF